MRVFIGIGSNLADPVQQTLTAIDEISRLPQTQWVASSSLYKSPPMGPQDQPDYINAVVEVDTQLSAHDLLDNLQQIENGHGRIRKRHWGERTLDLDILVFDTLVIEDERLRVPHPGVKDRAFVLYPLAEISPNLDIPVLGAIHTLLQHCEPAGLERMESTT